MTNATIVAKVSAMDVGRMTPFQLEMIGGSMKQKTINKRKKAFYAARRERMKQEKLVEAKAEPAVVAEPCTDSE